MSLPCDWTDPFSCGKALIGGAVSASVPPAWDAVCK